MARAATAPTDVQGFVDWFEALNESGPGQGDPLFGWLAKDADLAAMTWFLTQESVRQGCMGRTFALPTANSTLTSTATC